MAQTKQTDRGRLLLICSVPLEYKRHCDFQVNHQLAVQFRLKHKKHSKMKFLIFAAAIIAAASASVDSNEAALVQSTWAQVRNNEADILFAIFQAYPDIQARFPAFVGQDLNSLRGSSAFTLHASRIVSLISQYVSLLGSDSNQAAINTIFNQMGQTHRNRGIPQQQFTEFRTAFVNYLQANVAWNDNTAQAWNDALDQMFNIIFSNLQGTPVV
jgi:hypothetical protein